MNKVILIRFGELFLKGKNRHIFEKILLDNIDEKLRDYSINLEKIGGRYKILNYNENQEMEIIEKLRKVFGIHSISPAVELESNIQEIKDYVSTIRLNAKSFRVTVNRADKTFPYNSTEFSSILGGVILDNNNISVDLYNPETTVFVEVREQNKTYVYFDTYSAERGLPVGTSAKGMLLLSGGIDSPVAGYMMAKRGMKIDAVHFHSYPYTSELAKQKVVKLANILTDYVGEFNLYVISFTKIQEEINRKCASEFMITIMRRIMMRIAERLSRMKGAKAIITGESLGQVASQTVESITVTNMVLKNMPVLRPLIALDKEDITEISKKINTFSTSILPYEDCCTVFLPKHPLIKPRIDKVEKEESKLDIESLIKEALDNVEIIRITGDTNQNQ